MTRKTMTPFSTYSPRLCENPDCDLGPGGTRRTFTPTTPWQTCCSPYCRNRKATLKRKAKRDAEKAEEGKPFEP